MKGLTVRSYAEGDAVPLGLVFHRAVTEGAALRYGAAERRAWSPEPPATRRWTERLAAAETVVAEVGGERVGFMSLDMQTGYLDLAFVLPEVMGKGVADALYAVLESRARAAGLDRIETEASLFAEPFFLRHGWRLVARQEVRRLGVLLKNARMEKRLAREAAA